MKLKKCSCGKYTIKNKCSCGEKTFDAHYKFIEIRDAPKADISIIQGKKGRGKKIE